MVQIQTHTFVTDRLEPRQLPRVAMSSTDQLAEMFIFKGVERTALHELCAMAPPVSFKTGMTIFTQGDDWPRLRENVREAVDAFFFDQPKPTSIRLHMVRDEVLVAS